MNNNTIMLYMEKNYRNYFYNSYKYKNICLQNSKKIYPLKILRDLNKAS